MYGNNYGYFNPQRYTQPMYQQPQQEAFNSVQSRPVINGKQVESIDVVKAMDIPLDGSISYYPITDGSAIVTKQLQTDGTSKTIIYKPIKENEVKIEYITKDVLKEEIGKIDLSEIDDLKDEIKELRKEVKDLKKKKDD